MTCPACGYPRIPGITVCVNCGEPEESPDALFLRLTDAPIAPSDPAQVARWQAENTIARRYSRRLTEGRALEAAGDTAGALALYEAMLREGVIWPEPYRRLAVLYRRAKDAAAEERVCRAALGHLGERTNGWFITRLAKLLAVQRPHHE